MVLYARDPAHAAQRLAHLAVCGLVRTRTLLHHFVPAFDATNAICHAPCCFTFCFHQEVQKHRTPDDAWMVYQNKVYDVSGWHDHPGGHVIFTHAGDDFTDIFAAFHPPSAYKSMDPFYIGDLDTASIEIKPLAQVRRLPPVSTCT